MSVNEWLKSHQREIVILACSHFEGMDDKLHEAFILFLKVLFGSKLCPQVCSLMPPLLPFHFERHHNTENFASQNTTCPTHRGRSWPCGVFGNVVTRYCCPMKMKLQLDTRSCGQLSLTGGPTGTQQREWSVTWIVRKNWDAQVRFYAHSDPRHVS